MHVYSSTWSETSIRATHVCVYSRCVLGSSKAFARAALLSVFGLHILHSFSYLEEKYRRVSSRVSPPALPRAALLLHLPCCILVDTTSERQKTRARGKAEVGGT